jgi:threonine/homoserine/homoserine lactone efflux protein
MEPPQMSYAQNLWVYTALLFGIIIVPGMDMFFVMANALTGGWRLGLVATLGVMLGGVFHTVFGALAVGAVLQMAPLVFNGLLVAGGLYMAWIGCSLLRSSIVVDGVGAAANRSQLVAFRQGFITCALNPKAYMFTMAVYPAFMKPIYGPILGQAVVMGLLTIAMQFGIYGGVAMAAAKSRDLLVSNPGVTIIIGRVAGGLFLAVAALTLWHGVSGVFTAT